MKNIFLLIWLTGLTLLIHAQSPAKKSGHPALAMNDMAIESIVTAMKNSRNDDAKLMVIRNGIQNNTDGITVDQELKLLNQFASDDSKLSCAKFLYSWCVDYKSYDKIQYNMSTPAGQKALKAFVTSRVVNNTRPNL